MIRALAQYFRAGRIHWAKPCERRLCRSLRELAVHAPESAKMRGGSAKIVPEPASARGVFAGPCGGFAIASPELAVAAPKRSRIRGASAKTFPEPIDARAIPSHACGDTIRPSPKAIRVCPETIRGLDEAIRTRAIPTLTKSIAVDL